MSKRITVAALRQILDKLPASGVIVISHETSKHDALYLELELTKAVIVEPDKRSSTQFEPFLQLTVSESR